jgi:outer membrane receptor for ferrienterochelin and colicin
MAGIVEVTGMSTAESVATERAVGIGIITAESVVTEIVMDTKNGVKWMMGWDLVSNTGIPRGTNSRGIRPVHGVYRLLKLTSQVSRMMP